MSISKRILFVTIAVATLAGLFFILDYFFHITPLTRSYLDWAIPFYQKYRPYSFAVWIVPILVCLFIMVSIDDIGDDGNLGCLLLLIIFGIIFSYIVFLPLIIPVVISVILFYVPSILVLDKITGGSIREKRISIDICVIVGLALALALIPASREEIHWQWASHKDETASYESYMKTWPEGRHVKTAQRKLISLEDTDWETARQNNTLDSYKDI